MKDTIITACSDALILSVQDTADAYETHLHTTALADLDDHTYGKARNLVARMLSGVGIATLNAVEFAERQTTRARADGSSAIREISRFVFRTAEDKIGDWTRPKQ